MLKKEFKKMMIASCISLSMTHAGILDDTEKRDCDRNGTTVQATAYEQSLWLGKHASYSQAVGMLDIDLENGRGVIGTGTAIAPTLVLGTAHGYRSFQSGKFILNGVEYEISHMDIHPSAFDFFKKESVVRHDLCILHLRTPVPLDEFPALSTRSENDLFTNRGSIEGICVSGGLIQANLSDKPHKIRRHILKAKLLRKHSNAKYSDTFFSNHITAMEMQQIPAADETRISRLPGFRYNSRSPFLTGPLGRGDSGTSVFVVSQWGHQKKYELIALGARIMWGEAWDDEERVFRENFGFQNFFTGVSYNLPWIKKIIKKERAESYQPGLFEIEES